MQLEGISKMSPYYVTHSECYRTTIRRDDDGRINSIEIVATDLDGKTRAIRVEGSSRLAQITGTAARRGHSWRAVDLHEAIRPRSRSGRASGAAATCCETTAPN